MHNLDSAIASLKAELEQCNGEAYRGCWMDSVKDRTGQRTYHRLRWFISHKPRKLGSRTLKPTEVGQAQQAIALWTKLEKLEKERDRLEQMLWVYG